MKVAILAGGRGTRLAEETEVRPKPMVTVGGRPILWHIMRYYDHFGHDEFVVALGYKGEVIKQWVADYYLSARSFRVSTSSGEMRAHGPEQVEDWTVDLIDTGEWTNTGGRIKRLAPHIGDETFFLAWGDGLYDIDLHALERFHRSHGRLMTVAAVHPPPRFGQLEIEHGGRVAEFSEKPLDHSWINGGVFVCEPDVFEFIEDDKTQWEREPMEKLAANGEMMAFTHQGFWQPMDTLRDRAVLNRLWDSGSPPWKAWE